MGRSRPFLKAAFLLLVLSTSVAMGATDPDSLDPENDFSPMLAMFFVAGLAIMLLLVGIGIVVAAVVAVSCAVLAALGIVSSAAAVGLLRRRFSSGLRVFHYQVCAALSLPAGIGLLAVLCHFFAPQLQVWQIIVIGAVAGGAAGLLIAWVFDRLAVLACRRLAVLTALPGAR
ncbi:MAG: hypothetical protein JWO94_2081 [Verrucomicrobiaceae bacterium]|nr:hypothetical protein [Verrucomicrobiaceae bacterium]